ncbi:M23 family metallopeptidase [Oscillibacter sp.]|uniref:M23 family metallopeptidase n=1 Tax=Oscillibacter sp. TaxID=1945593 RepID=UPI0028ABF529|nr:M23 family metallopeptidase [Oscillibacter sp.]
MSLSAAAVAKTAAVLLSGEDSRRRLACIILAVLSPVIVVVIFLLSLASGSAGHNVSAAQLCFQGGTIPDTMPAEYQTYISEMQSSFSLLDQLLADINAQTENGDTVDETRVKAIFYALYFGDDQPGRRATARFADCFVTYEERSQTVTNNDGTTSEEPYTVAVPITDLSTIWSNVESTMEVEVTPDIQSNAESIYALIRFGWTGGSAWSEELGEALVSADGFCSPLGAGWESRVTSEFGYRICPYHGRELHSGLDMAAPTDTPIRAALDGTVAKSYYSSSYGNYIVIDHGNGLTTGYAHQSKRMVKKGDTVTAGQVIGLVGSTGNSTGAHLHFEVRVNGEAQNPRYFLPKS